MIWLMVAVWCAAGYGLALLSMKLILGEVWVRDLFLCLFLAGVGPLLLFAVFPLLLESIPSGWLKKKVF